MAHHPIHERNPNLICRTKHFYAPHSLSSSSFPNPPTPFLAHSQSVLKGSGKARVPTHKVEQTVVQVHIEAKLQYGPPDFPKFFFCPMNQSWTPAHMPTSHSHWGLMGPETGGTVQQRQIGPRSKWQLGLSGHHGWQLSHPTQNRALGPQILGPGLAKR